jgi:hypothetical protein
MSIALRPAVEADVPDLARLYIMATAGLMDAVYADLTTDAPLEKLLEWRFTQLGSVRSYEHCLIAQEDSRVAGMINAFPIGRLEEAVGRKILVRPPSLERTCLTARAGRMR